MHVCFVYILMCMNVYCACVGGQSMICAVLVCVYMVCYDPPTYMPDVGRS